MKINPSRFVISVLILLVVMVYLFVTAPTPLVEASHQDRLLSVKTIMEIANQENSAVRALYTTEIVAAGKKAGIKFDEHWKDEDVEAGPLPAQFLRETARYLERTPVRLGLYLGSDYPINNANHFEGMQLEMFLAMRRDRQPRFFRVADSGSYAYLFADIAIAKPCVECHNAHQQSPKTNWRLDDVMGATTWTYPTDTLSLVEAIQILDALRQGFRAAYSAYLKKMATLDNPPRIGTQWPREGYYLPSVEVFMAEIEQRVAVNTLNRLMTVNTESITTAPVTIHNESL